MPNHSVQRELQSDLTTAAPASGRHARLSLGNGGYILVLVAVIAGTGAYSVRKYGVLNCQASGYGTDRYLAYCGATAYGDYDHGAFWFGLEPAASLAAANAQVLFLGNSRLQFGLSTEATDRWFRSIAARYYLLGFSYNGNYLFEAPLLEKLRPRASVYVINIDLFFEPQETDPARVVRRDSAAPALYHRKRQWQRIHRTLCANVPRACGTAIAFYRSRTTGAWLVNGGRFSSKAVSYDDRVDETVVRAYAARGREFVSSLPVQPGCVMLTIVPTVTTPIGTARAIAHTLGVGFVAPALPGLMTFDASHLDQPSAQRWSNAFVESVGPRIRECLNVPPEPPSASR